MKNYFKVQHQENTIYFDEFDENYLHIYRDENSNLIINIEIWTKYTERTDVEIARIENSLGTKIDKEANEGWVQLRFYHTNYKTIDQLIDKPILIKEGYNINIEKDSAAHMGIYSGRELFNSKILLTKKDEEFYVKWEAELDDIIYYDQRAEISNLKLEMKLTLTDFDTEDKYFEYSRNNLN